MKSVIVFPNCKINIGLHITRKREDGYHDLQTIFYPLPLKDMLEVATRSDQQQPVKFTMSGLPVAGDASNNLCLKAWQLLKTDFPQLPSLQLHLHKNIPMGAGLGGGSADGAFTLKLLNDKYRLQLSEEQLLQYALQLGSDCPFFIPNTPSYATGRGELLAPVQLDLSAYSFALIHPSIHISTAWAFANITPAESLLSLKDAITKPVEQWKDLISNDFEAPVCAHYPTLQKVKEDLYQAGAVYAAMSGSGSSFYGIFQKGKLDKALLRHYESNMHIC
ncbi:MAG: 4-(cytidine 5'-diphospho)-2-C-methyl-D-erythritol kinase [Chitinophagaceae bacterium]